MVSEILPVESRMVGSRTTFISVSTISREHGCPLLLSNGRVQSLTRRDQPYICLVGDISYQLAVATHTIVPQMTQSDWEEQYTQTWARQRRSQARPRVKSDSSSMHSRPRSTQSMERPEPEAPLNFLAFVYPATPLRVSKRGFYYLFHV